MRMKKPCQVHYERNESRIIQVSKFSWKHSVRLHTLQALGGVPLKRRLHVRVRNGKKSSKLFDRRRRKVFPRRLLVVNSWYWASICKGKYIAETVWKKTSYSLSKPFSLVANSSVVIIFYFIWATFLSYNARSSVLRRTCISNCVFPLFPRKLSTIFCLVYSLPCDLEI